MKHHGTLLRTVLRNVFGVQSFRQNEIKLQGAALPDPADGVLQREFQLGAVEGALAGLQHQRLARRLGGGRQGGLGLVPDLVGPGAQFRTRRELGVRQRHAQVVIDAAQQFDEPRAFLRDLLFAAEDVGVVLGEGAHPHDAVHGARRLVAVAGAELGHAQRQLAIGLLADVEDLDVTRAVHRLDGQDLALGALAHEHGVAELLGVARLLPQALVEDLRSLHLLVAGRVQATAHVVLEHAVERPALRVPEHHALALFLDVEEVHGLAQLAVIALLGFLDALQIGFEIGFRGPRGAVDALQLGVVLVAAPVGAGQLGQLEGLADVLGRGQVRTAAQVLPGALAIDRDRIRVRQVADDLRLVLLADRVEVSDGLVAVPDLARDLLVAIDDLLHALFDLFQIVQAERLVTREVVIEAVLDVRADRDLGARKQLLHGLGQDVGRVVTDGVEGLGRIARQNLELALASQQVGRQRTVEVQQLAVQLDQQGLLFQRLGDGGGDVAARGAVRILSRGAVGENQIDHSSHFHLRGWCRGGGGS